MSVGFGLVLLFAFLAVVLLLEGAYLLWNSKKGPEAKRMEKRLRALSEGGHAAAAATLLKRDNAEPGNQLEALLLKLPRAGWVSSMVRQSGVDVGPGRLLLMCLVLAVLGYVIGYVLQFLLPMHLAVTAGLGYLPIAYVLRRRGKRFKQLEAQLPEAIDLIARALRAGHAFQAALTMVGEEGPQPMAAEFQIVHEEINYGVALPEAFMNLAGRVPIEDLRFFVIAVLLQRETGGNLAEVLQNISHLIRQRFQLLGKVRVLAAEGKMSAWVLTLLPFGAAGLILLVKRDFMSILWTDPAGLKLVYLILTSMAFGIFWMWRIVKIRV